MTTIVSTINDLLGLFPENSVSEGPRAYEGPCPYCAADGSRGQSWVNSTGKHFVGEDRFKIWFENFGTYWCQQCHRSGKISELVDFLDPGSVVTSSIVMTMEPTKLRHRESVLLTEFLVGEDNLDKKHAVVRTEFWKAFGWSDKTIEDLRLGYGAVWDHGTYGAMTEPRHLFPLRISDSTQVFDGWIYEGRRTGDSGPKTVKPAGSDKGFFGIHINPGDDTIVIVEGSKDGGSAYELGYTSFMVLFGAGKWDAHMAKFLVDQGFTTIILAGDNDESGQKFVKRASEDCHQVSLTPRVIAWAKDLKEGYDLTDLLVDQGREKARQYVDGNANVKAPQKGFIANYKLIDPTYNRPDPTQATPVEQVRRELGDVLRDFIANYKLHKRDGGAVQVLAAPPGSGKSYSLVQFVQEQAQAWLKKRKADLEQIDEAIAELEALKVQEPEWADKTEEEIIPLRRKKENYSVAKILFASPFINGWDDIINQPGFDPELWFNLQARSPENCEQYGTVSLLGKAGYSVSRYCETGCPVFELCRQRGYQMQDKIRKTRPITFVRHANLVSETLLDEYALIIIDEDFLNTFAGTLTLTDSQDLRPASVTWSDFTISDKQRDDVLALCTALRHALAEQGTFAGRTFMGLLARYLPFPVSELGSRITQKVIDLFQPNAAPIGFVPTELPSRVLPIIYQAVADELDDYASGAVEYNTRIRLVDGKLSVSKLFPVEVAASKPIIVADGTASPQLYGALFGRKVLTYAPTLYNEQALIVQVTGTDFTLSAIRTIRGERQTDRVTDLLGDDLVVDEMVEATDAPYGNFQLHEALLSIKTVADMPRHNHILVVGRLRYIDILTDHLPSLLKADPTYKTVMEKCTFAHYQSLRGTNRYKDYDSIILLGCPRISYDLIHAEAQAWARLMGYPQYIKNEIIGVPTPYHGEYLEAGYAHPTFADPLARLLVDRQEVGEIRQCVDRIRLYSSKGRKTAYCIMNRPAVLWVTEMAAINKFVVDPSSKAYFMAKKVRDEHGILPTVQWLIQQANCTKHHATKALNRLSRQNQNNGSATPVIH